MMTVIFETCRIGFTSAGSIKKSIKNRIPQNPAYQKNTGHRAYYVLKRWLNISSPQMAPENWYAERMDKFNAVEPSLWIQI
jgi:hypothetical protein